MRGWHKDGCMRTGWMDRMRAHEWASWHNWVRGLHEGLVGQDGTAGVGRQAS